MGQCVLRKWVVGGGRLYGYFGEQGPPVGVQKCLEGFHLECAEYLSRQFVPKWNNPVVLFTVPLRRGIGWDS